jgi:hypothetical protein
VREFSVMAHITARRKAVALCPGRDSNPHALADRAF